MRRSRQAFPVGLYGMLLFALCWLTLPTVFAPLERWGLGLVSLVPELAASWRGTFDVWIHHPDVPVGGEPIDIYDPEALRRSLAPADRGAG